MLLLFDLDDTLIEGYMNKRPFDDVVLLPGRKDTILSRIEQGDEIAIITNQGGVAFGYHTQLDVEDKLEKVYETLELPLQLRVNDGVAAWECDYACEWQIADLDHMNRYIEAIETDDFLNIFVCYAHPNAPEDEWRVGSERRKPSAAMIQEAIAMAKPESVADGVLFVGDRPEDEQAAINAGVSFLWASEFFGDKKEGA